MGTVKGETPLTSTLGAWSNPAKRCSFPGSALAIKEVVPGIPLSLTFPGAKVPLTSLVT